MFFKSHLTSVSNKFIIDVKMMKIMREISSNFCQTHACIFHSFLHIRSDTYRGFEATWFAVSHYQVDQGLFRNRRRLTRRDKLVGSNDVQGTFEVQIKGGIL